MEVFHPVYTRAPNKLIEYFLEDFDDGCGHKAIIRYAKWVDKKGKEQISVAQVMWG